MTPLDHGRTERTGEIKGGQGRSREDTQRGQLEEIMGEQRTGRTGEIKRGQGRSWEEREDRGDHGRTGEIKGGQGRSWKDREDRGNHGRIEAKNEQQPFQSSHLDLGNTSVDI